MNSKNITTILIIIVIVLTGTTLYFTTTKKVIQPAVPMVQQPTQWSDEITSWWLYRNEKYGFEEIVEIGTATINSPLIRH